MLALSLSAVITCTSHTRVPRTPIDTSPHRPIFTPAHPTCSRAHRRAPGASLHRLMWAAGHRSWQEEKDSRWEQQQAAVGKWGLQIIFYIVTRQSWLVWNQTEHSSRHFAFNGWSSASPLIPFSFSGKGLKSERLRKSSSPQLRGWGLLAALSTETFHIFQYLAVDPQNLVTGMFLRQMPFLLSMWWVILFPKKNTSKQLVIT